jgi:hypothetical protein
MLEGVDHLAQKVRAVLFSKFKIDHPILQFETKAYASKDLLCNLCRQSPPRVKGNSCS